MQASFIIPIVSIFALLLKSLFGINIGEEGIQLISDGILSIALGVIGIYGVFKAHQKNKQLNK